MALENSYFEQTTRSVYTSQRTHDSLQRQNVRARTRVILKEIPLPARAVPRSLSNRRDGRVVEGARLESVFRGNSNVGSNPTLSASYQNRRSQALSPRKPEGADVRAGVWRWLPRGTCAAYFRMWQSIEF
jgi:hypothetical protein